MNNDWIKDLPWLHINYASHKYFLNPNIIASIIMTESSNNRFALRFEPRYKYFFKIKENAAIAKTSEITEATLQMFSFGLTQIMGGVAREYGLTGSMLQLTDVAINLDFCGKHLKRFYDRYKTEEDMLASYNAGSPVKLPSGLYKNQNYVDKVLAYKSLLDKNGD